MLPKGAKPGRPPVHSERQLINGMRFRTRTGMPWRDLPDRYGPRETVYGPFRRWQRDGTWHRIFEQLRARSDAKGLSPGTSRWTPRSPERTSVRPVPAKGGSAGRAARRRLHRARRPRARTLARWTDHQGPPRG
ncbi:transposase [Streptomyces sp. NPDC086147]|uniref:transposase n=1 Tax=Streptomyces sp. NPDC086147 TaxID=3155295 RepID=UPI00344D35ED